MHLAAHPAVAGLRVRPAELTAIRRTPRANPQAGRTHAGGRDGHAAMRPGACLRIGRGGAQSGGLPLAPRHDVDDGIAPPGAAPSLPRAGRAPAPAPAPARRPRGPR